MSLSGYETREIFAETAGSRENVLSGESRLEPLERPTDYVAYAKIVTDFARDLPDDWLRGSRVKRKMTKAPCGNVTQRVQSHFYCAALAGRIASLMFI